MPTEYPRSCVVDLSLDHLHPYTQRRATVDLSEMMNFALIGVHEYGFIASTGYGDDDSLWEDCRETNINSLINHFPDFALLRAFARGLKVMWLNFHVHGPIFDDDLPVYDIAGIVSLPRAGGSQGLMRSGHFAVRLDCAARPSFQLLKELEFEASA